jgi:hypothetical protein
MCLNETFSRVRVCKRVPDMFPTKNSLKKGNGLSPLLLNITLDYAIRKAQVMEVGLKLKGKHQLLIYADDVNILGGNLHTINKNTKSLLVFSKENGLEVNADKPKYVVMSRQQNAGNVTM